MQFVAVSLEALSFVKRRKKKTNNHALCEQNGNVSLENGPPLKCIKIKSAMIRFYFPGFNFGFKL